jgi:hypothetical protein
LFSKAVQLTPENATLRESRDEMLEFAKGLRVKVMEVK